MALRNQNDFHLKIGDTLCIPINISYKYCLKTMKSQLIREFKSVNNIQNKKYLLLSTIDNVTKGNMKINLMTIISSLMVALKTSNH